jgi:hypothetical protein
MSDNQLKKVWANIVSSTFDSLLVTRDKYEKKIITAGLSVCINSLFFG